MTGETNGAGWYEPGPGRHAPMPRRYAPGQRPHEWAPGLRASDREREDAVGLLKAAFGEGRLTREELDARTGQALAAAYRADLAPIVADLPGGAAFGAAPRYPRAYAPPPPVNILAVASLLCSVFGVALPGVILGHVARGQIRDRGERGGGLALAGLMLGWAEIGVSLCLALLVVALMSMG